MFEVAADAIFPVRIPHLKLGMISVISGEPLGDFFMTIQAFECRGAGAELMTAGALCGPGKRLMRFGEGTRRDLCVCKTHKQERSKKENEKTPQPCRPRPLADVTSDSRLAEDQDVLRLSTSKQQMRAWQFQNNMAGRLAGRKAGQCVQSEKPETVPWRTIPMLAVKVPVEIPACGVPAGGAVAK